MMPTQDKAKPAGAGWRRFAALILAVAAVGLPVNDFGVFALLLAAAVVIFIGEVSVRPGAWAAAIVIVAVSAAGQFLLAPPRIEEGHNVFLPDAEVLQRGLPADVYRQMAQEFDALYPPAVRCRPASEGCWLDQGRPDKVYAYSGDSLWHKTEASRSVTGIDFSDPVWLRIGFTNEIRYNWFTAAPDVHRNDRDRRFWMGLKRWHLAMPWFEMIRLPAAFAGSELCWRGEVMWEGAGDRFSLWPGEGCRTIEAADAGRRIFGIAIKPDTLAMRLTPPWKIRIRNIVGAALTGIAVICLVGALVRFRARQLLLPAILILLALLVIAIDDASFLGGLRPFDGGDDGLFYEGAGRKIIQDVLAGNWAEALRGDEDIFYFTSPAIRYFRAVEQVIFGDTSFGYLSLMLVLPFVVYNLFRRNLPERWSVALIVIFIAIPVGAVFGSTYFQYVKWAARGFADPAGAAFLIAATLVLVGRSDNDSNARFRCALCAGWLFFLAVAMRPNLAPFTGVMLGAAGALTIWRAQTWRLAGLVCGFLPVLAIPLHNWVYGRQLVLFTNGIAEPGNLPTPPTVYLSALGEMIHLDFFGKNIRHAGLQIVDWLIGPSESMLAVPLNAAAVVVVLRVLFAKTYGFWLRTIAGATLAEHAVALFYRPASRYYYVTWLFTFVLCAVWVRTEGLGWLWRSHPAPMNWVARQSIMRPLAKVFGQST